MDEVHNLDIDSALFSRIHKLRLIDDDFMSVVFDGDIKTTEFILRIILERDDLFVKSVITQKEKRNLFGRSVRLDIIAEDIEGKKYNIEVQRADKGASPKRVRYNLAMLDSHFLHKNADFEQLPETFVIFITENDYYGRDQAFYKNYRTVKIQQTSNERNLGY